jgi:UPF0271 protein
MVMATIDLNSDLGEGFGAWTMGEDLEMLELVTSANIACGFHAGDPSIMIATCRAAAESGVVIGAHPSYRDLAGFGRRAMDIDADDLYADVVYQVGALIAAATVVGSAVRYVKPHGALYNVAVRDHAQAEAVVRAIADVDPGLAVLALPGSALLAEAARAGLRGVAEAFADRGYLADGSLVPRTEPGSVLYDPSSVADRVVRLVTESTVVAADGSPVEVLAQSVCVHGDSPGAVEMARAIRRRLDETDVTVAPFVAEAVGRNLP